MDSVTTKGDIEVLEVQTSSDLMIFLKIPMDIYKDDPHWVPPLFSERKSFFDKEKHPFYRAAKTRLFVARKNGTYVGRIATCINFNHNEFHEEKTGFFGFFDVIEDYSVAEVLFRVALITIKGEGMEQMIGPANFSTNHEVGMLIEGYDHDPNVMCTYNYPYYNDFAEKFGFRKAKDLVGFLMEPTAALRRDPRMQRVADVLRRRARVNMRTLRMDRFDEEVDIINGVYNQAWSRNWGFVPMSEAEFKQSAQDFKQIVDPELVLIAEVDGRAIGFCMALPNVNQVLKYLNGRLFPFGLLKLFWHTKIKNKIDSVRLITFGLIPEYWKRGIDNLFYLDTFKACVERGYKWGELSWILEDNFPMVRAAELMGAQQYKRWRMYGLKV